MSLDGKVAFITGAARGQGRAHAVRLAREGVKIIGVDICKDIASMDYPNASEADLAETVKQVEALGGAMIATKADVRDVRSDRRPRSIRVSSATAGSTSSSPMPASSVSATSPRTSWRSGTTSSTPTSPACSTR